MTGSILFRESDARRGFLADLHDDEVAAILSYTQARRYRTGEPAVQFGERERSVYIVTAGRFEVLIPTPAGPRQVAVLQPGDMFGELAFFDNQPRSADVRALEESEAVIMTPAGFDRLRLAYPRLAMTFVLDLGRILSMRFRDYSHRLGELGDL